MNKEKCDYSIYQNGKVVCMISAGKDTMNEVIANANMILGITNPEDRMDWHFAAGVAIVKTLGNVERAKRALDRCLPKVYNYD